MQLDSLSSMLDFIYLEMNFHLTPPKNDIIPIFNLKETMLLMFNCSVVSDSLQPHDL